MRATTERGIAIPTGLPTMPIKNDQELAAAVKEASTLLQAINDFAGRKSRQDAAVRFPRGFLRTADEHRERLKFIRNKDLRSNLAYTLLMSDAVYWLLIRTDVSGMAREMLVKLFVSIGGTLIESITREYLRGSCGKSYKERTQYLLATGVIDEELRTELDWVWDTRNNMHLFMLEGSEYTNEYNVTTHTCCVAAFKRMVDVFAAKGPLSTPLSDREDPLQVSGDIANTRPSGTKLR